MSVAGGASTVGVDAVEEGGGPPSVNTLIGTQLAGDGLIGLEDRQPRLQVGGTGRGSGGLVRLDAGENLSRVAQRRTAPFLRHQLIGCRGGRLFLNRTHPSAACRRSWPSRDPLQSEDLRSPPRIGR